MNLFSSKDQIKQQKLKNQKHEVHSEIKHEKELEKKYDDETKNSDNNKVPNETISCNN